MLEPCDGKLSSTVLRGGRPCKGAHPTRECLLRVVGVVLLFVTFAFFAEYVYGLMFARLRPDFSSFMRPAFPYGVGGALFAFFPHVITPFVYRKRE